MRSRKPLDPNHGKLEQDLEQTRARVGDANYAHATAHHFAKGGKYNTTRKKQRYALT